MVNVIYVWHQDVVKREAGWDVLMEVDCMVVRASLLTVLPHRGVSPTQMTSATNSVLKTPRVQRYSLAVCTNLKWARSRHFQRRGV